MEIITITELVGAINNKVNAATPKDKAIRTDILAPILSLNAPKNNAPINAPIICRLIEVPPNERSNPLETTNEEIN